MAFAAFRLSCLFVAIAAGLSSLELLSVGELYADIGLLSGRVHRAFGATGARAMLAVRLVLALLVGALAAVGSVEATRATCAALAGLLVAHVVMVRRLGWACDGADYMLTILVAGLAGYALLPRAGFAFIAIQACLAYASAGVAKVCSPLWRSGDAVTWIVSTTTFGDPRLGRWSRGRPSVSRLIAWGVMGFECAFPLTILAPRSVLLAILAAGAGFHVVTAAVMGVNGFVWSFVGTYPSIFLVNAMVHAGRAP